MNNLANKFKHIPDPNTTEQQKTPSLCLNCQLAPQVNRQVCLPILSMLQVGRNLGVHINSIAFGVTHCDHIMPVEQGEAN